MKLADRLNTRELMERLGLKDAIECISDDITKIYF